MTRTVSATLDQIRTPGRAAGALDSPMLPALAAWLGVRLIGKPQRFGKVLVAARHRHVAELLARDLDFGIAPVNAGRMDAVNGAFVLGLDRGDQLATERRALYAALASVDMQVVAARAGEEADALLAAAGGSIDVVGGYARLVAAGTARRLFGVSGPDETTFVEVIRAVFAHTFLNLGGDKAVEGRAVKASILMRAWLADEIARRRAGGATGADVMGGLMRQPGLDDEAVRRTLGGMLVGSIDTTASAFAKIVYVMAKDPAMAASARRDAGDPVRLRGWCWEALRRWPHNPLIMREALADTTLAGVAVPKGRRVVAWTQAAMLDADAFPGPGLMRADRSPRAYLHFGGGLHPCAGRAVNDWQLPMLVGKLLQRGLGGVDRISWAGPFPDHLTARLGAAR